MATQPRSRSAEILRAVHRSPGLPRATATRDLGISSGLATEAVARLIDAALLAEAPSPPSGTRGRPSQQLTAHPHGPLVAGVAISYEGWELALSELGGAAVLHKAGRHDRRWPSLRRTLQGHLDRAAADHRGRIVNLCVSVPGTVSDGHLIQAPGLGWSDVDIAGAFQPPGALGVLVDNDATFSAIAEARRGATRGERSVIHIYMDNGIGGALLEDGRVIAGAQGIAGEFGHMPFGVPDVECRCGALGCWNTAVGEIDPDGADALGRGAAALVNGFDPSMICLGGLAVDLRAIAPDRVDAAYRRGLMSSRRSTPPPIVDGRLGERGPLVGAAEHGFDALLTDEGLAAWNAR